MLAGDCVLSARQRGAKILFFLPPAHHCKFNQNRATKLKRVRENAYEAVSAVPLVRQDFAAAITALSSLSVSPAKKPRIRRND
jgi:hypothetical protein